MSAIAPIRVLQVFASLDRGGAETAIMAYYRLIDRERIQFDFAVHTSRRGAYEDEAEALGGHVYRLPRLRGLNLVAYRRAWRKLLDSHPDISVVHGHFFTISSLYLPIASRVGVRTIGHSHNDVPGFKGLLIRLLNRSLPRKVDLMAACSTDAARFFYGTKLVRQGDVIVINNAIDVDKFRFDSAVRTAMRRDLRIEGKFVLGHVGRFEYSKNHFFLLEIFAEVHRRDSDSVLLLVGDGSRRTALEERVAELDLVGNVIFTGVRADVEHLLQAMDVFVFPSLYEGLGIVAVEAQASGLPTIVSDQLPRDIEVTALLETLPLTAGTGEWASAILDHRECQTRSSPVAEISRGGFDITREVGKLERLYLNLVGDGEL